MIFQIGLDHPEEIGRMRDGRMLVRYVIRGQAVYIAEPIGKDGN